MRGRSVNRLILQSLSNTVRRFQWRHPPRLPNWRQQTYRNLSSYFKFLVGGGTIYCLSGVALTVNAAEANPLHSSQHKLGKKEEERAIAEADSLFSLYQVDRLYEFLKKFEHTDSAQLCWRLARAACDKAKNCNPKSEERKKLMYEGFQHAKRSLELSDKCGSCHKWYALMLNYVGDYEGNKQKIQYSYIVQDHFMKAIELNPKDATSMYCLGQWCYFFADMSWYIQKIAAIIFSSPPTSTFEEALKYFLMAEETDPNFYSMNHLMLAKTYLKMNQKDKARSYLLKARDFPVISPDDKQAHTESIELLQNL